MNYIFERILLDSYTPYLQIVSACHQTQLQGGGGVDDRTCVFHNHTSSCESIDLAKLDPFSRYGLTKAPVERAVVKINAKRHEVGICTCYPSAVSALGTR